tara:strand:- start:296 stop:601 length:306 start_codon:yes stop_codon:yes gene_type:complete
MSSVRPKLKPETPKSVTAWETASGRTVWMDADGNWTADAARIAAFTGDEAEAHLARALKQEGVVTDPYFMEVTETGAIAGRETLRETIRVNGPTVAYGEDA